MPTARAYAPGLLALAALMLACGAGVEHTRLSDGSYRLKCEHELGRCLSQMEKACAAYGYDVIRAGEKRTRTGPSVEFGELTIRSEAHVRCRTAHATWSFDETPPGAAPAPEPLPAHAPLPPLTALPAPAAPAAPAPAPTPAPAPAPSVPPP